MGVADYHQRARALEEAHAAVEKLFAFVAEADRRKWDARFTFGGHVLCMGSGPSIDLIVWPSGKTVADAIEVYHRAKAEENDAYTKLPPEDQKRINRPVVH
jgi:hypothetical protein